MSASHVSGADAGAAPAARASRLLAPERAVWLIGGLFGLAFVAVTPPGDPPDEKVHYARALLVSEGRLGVVGRRPGYGAAVPRSIVALHPEPEGHHPPELLARFRMAPRPRAAPHTAEGVLEQARRPLVPRRRERVFYVTSYSPLPYLHQAAAVWIGRSVGGSLGAGLYPARLANLAVFLAAAAAAVRLSPTRRWTLALLALSPAAIFQAAAVSADPPTVAVAFLVTALAWRAAEGGGPHARDRRVRAAFIASCAALGLTKLGYWPLAGLAHLVPGRSFASVRGRAAWVLGAAAAVTLPSCAWLLHALSVDPVPLAPGADAGAQLAGIAREPWSYAVLLGETFARAWRHFGMGCVGWLGHHDVLLPAWLYVALPLVWAASALWGGADPPWLGLRARALCALLFALGCVGVATLAYLGWNAVGAPTIRGVQGRYFIPLLPLLAVLLPGRRSPPGRRGDALYAAAAAVALATALFAVVRAYYAA